MDLSTSYLGLALPHPFVAGASPLSDTVERCQHLAAAGIAAIVLRSLFEEQIAQEALAHHQAVFGHTEAHGEARTYLPAADDSVFGPDQYLAHLRAVKRAVPVPVIASLNGHTESGWIDYGKRIEDAGADALELNLYSVATDTGESGAEVEDRAVMIVRQVARSLRIPVAVKLSPFYTSLPHFALRLREAGATGLVLFNRFFEPDLDLEALELHTHMDLSHRSELLLRLRWLALLSGQVDVELAVSGGVHTATDAIKAVMCGAHCVQLVSALLKGGAERTSTLCAEVRRWLQDHGYESLRQMRGSMDHSRSPDPKALERANYMRALQTYRVD
ncbi:MAG: dihydroorotate dehydrogenase-like protein [Planctomycetes bacterium]|nr:dihydroorotate dehydrogenase-like protein [Planctomycetota bacterium]